MPLKDKVDGNTVNGNANADTLNQWPNFSTDLDEKVLQEKWTLLKNAIGSIQAKKSPSLCFTQLYDLVFSLMQNKKGKMVYEGVKELITQFLGSNVRVDVMASLNKDNFLDTVANSWDQHQNAMRAISGLLLHVDKLYVVQNDQRKVSDMGLILFKDEVLRYGAIKDSLRETLLMMVTKDRNGEVVNRQAIKSACNLLVVMGLKSKSLYEEYFEAPFLKQSTDFYQSEAKSYLAVANASYYVTKVAGLIEQENKRVKDCFDEMTAPKLLKVYEQHLITANMMTVLDMKNGGVFGFFQEDNIDDLNAMYLLFKRDPKGIEVLH